MIIVYTIKYIAPTNTKGARVKVTRLSDKESRIIPFIPGAADVVAKTIQWTFGESADKLEFICHLNASESMYAIQHN